MCGIVAYSGKKPADVDFIKILLLESQQRGTDATGIGWLHNSKDKFSFKYVKDTINSTDFVWTYAEDLPTDANNIVAHTRNSSTATEKKVDDAHPFPFNRLIGVHNGYISNFKALNTKYDTKYTVDSRVLYHIINEKGIEEALKEVRGNMALAWIDNKKQMNLYRYHNPTYLGFVDGGVYIASARKYLEAIDVDKIEITLEQEHYIIKDGEVISHKDVGEPKTYHQRDYYGCGYPRSEVSDDGKDEVVKAMKDNKILEVSKMHDPGKGVPKEAVPMYQDGMMHYFWLENQKEQEDTTVYVVSLFAYGNQKTQKFYLNSHGTEALKGEFLEIYKYLKLDNDDE